MANKVASNEDDFRSVVEIKTKPPQGKTTPLKASYRTFSRNPFSSINPSGRLRLNREGPVSETSRFGQESTHFNRKIQQKFYAPVGNRIVPPRGRDSLFGYLDFSRRSAIRGISNRFCPSGGMGVKEGLFCSASGCGLRQGCRSDISYGTHSGPGTASNGNRRERKIQKRNGERLCSASSCRYGTAQASSKGRSKVF